jgi:hypothetical protein
MALTEEQNAKIKRRKAQTVVETATCMVASAALGSTVGYVGELALQEIRERMRSKQQEKLNKQIANPALSTEEKTNIIEKAQKKAEVIDNVVTAIGRGAYFVGSYCVGHVIGQTLQTKIRERNYDIVKITSASKGKENPPKGTK